MSFERGIIITKLKGYSTGALTKNEVYEWALFVAVSREYELMAKQDPLAERVIQFFIEINSESPKSVSSQNIAQYFIDCLEDRKEFSYESLKAFSTNKPAAQATAVTPSTAKKKPPEPVKLAVDPFAGPVSKPVNFSRIDLEKIFKFYVFVFAGIVVLLNLVSALNPNFLVRPEEIPPTTAESWSAAFPHIIYGIIIILALVLKVPKIVFYFFFFFSVLGMFFYWYVATDLLLKNGRPLVYLLLIAPLVSLPPTAGFYILLQRWVAELPRNKPKLRMDI